MRRYAKVDVKKGDGLSLLKIRKIMVAAEESGRSIIRTVIMMQVRCEINDAHAIYRILNLTVSNKLRLGVYVFDYDECK